jgi:hypothetical protein
LASEIFPLALNENSKKKRTTYRKHSNEVLRAVRGWNHKGELVLKYSKKFLVTMDDLKANGYALKEAKANFMVYWTDEANKKEVKIILPTLFFEKVNAISDSAIT